MRWIALAGIITITVIVAMYVLIVVAAVTAVFVLLPAVGVGLIGYHTWYKHLSDSGQETALHVLIAVGIIVVMVVLLVGVPYLYNYSQIHGGLPCPYPLCCHHPEDNGKWSCNSQ